MVSGIASSGSRPRILLVDDDPDIAGLLTRYLGQHGYEVSHARDGQALQRRLKIGDFDLILLDLGLPDADGLTLLRGFQNHWQGPVIVVSGRGEAVERVVGLELGADDYVSKPFDLRELLARIHSVLRRFQQPAHDGGQPIEFDGMRLDPAARRLTGRDGGDIPLTSGDFELLHVLLRHPNQVLSRDQLMNQLHGHDAGPNDRSIDVRIGRLRRKIERDAEHAQLIQSVRSAGYMLSLPSGKA